MNATQIALLVAKGFTINGNEITYRFKSLNGHVVYTLDTHNAVAQIELKIVKKYNLVTVPGFYGFAHYKPSDRPSFFDTDYQRDLFGAIHRMARNENIAEGQRNLYSMGDEYKGIQYYMDVDIAELAA